MQHHRDDFSREKSQDSERLCQLVSLLATSLGILVPSLANFCHPLLVYLAYARGQLVGNESRKAGAASTTSQVTACGYLQVVMSCAYAFSTCVHSSFTICVLCRVSTCVLLAKLVKTIS